MLPIAGSCFVYARLQQGVTVGHVETADAGKNLGSILQAEKLDVPGDLASSHLRGVLDAVSYLVTNRCRCYRTPII